MVEIQNVGVVGTGSWGTALASVAAQRASHVQLWGRDEKTSHEITRHHTNRRYLPEITLPSHLTGTTQLSDLVGADLIVVAVPSRALRDVAMQLAGMGLAPSTIVVSATKGIERDTGLRMSEVLAQCLPQNPIAVLSGPNHAEEVARGLAAAAVIGSHDEAAARALQAFFSLPWLRTYTSADVAGMEWGGAAKNVFAIAAGISEGLGLGDNARAALVTRGLAEMTRLGMAAGGQFETFQGLSGMGDLIVTCYSRHSRNNRVGNLLGRGQPLDEIVQGMSMVAEGVPNTESIYHAARQRGVRTPIIDQVYAILYGQKSPGAALTELLSRDPRPETENGAA
jgi:glycerol-3-phosphate dehydrogenase (NAD(P)+)